MKTTLKIILLVLVIPMLIYFLPGIISFPIIWVIIGLTILKVGMYKYNETEAITVDILLAIILGPFVLLLIDTNILIKIANKKYIKKTLTLIAKVLKITLRYEK